MVVSTATLGRRSRRLTAATHALLVAELCANLAVVIVLILLLLLPLLLKLLLLPLKLLLLLLQLLLLDPRLLLDYRLLRPGRLIRLPLTSPADEEDTKTQDEHRSGHEG